MNKAEQLRYEYFRVKELTNKYPTDENFKRLAQALSDWDDESNKITYEEAKSLRKKQFTKFSRIRRQVELIKDGISLGEMTVPKACEILGAYHKKIIRAANKQQQINGYSIKILNQ